MVVHLFFLALSVAYVVAQAPIPSVSQSVRGSCPPFDLAQLLYNNGERFMLSTLVSSGQMINIMDAKVVCQSLGLQRNTFSSVTVIVLYTCIGTCPPAVIVAHFSFACQKDNTNYAFSDYTVLTHSPLYFQFARVFIPGRCSLCASDAAEGCVGCEIQCPFAGTGYCVSGDREGTASCCSWYYQGSCVSDCPSPYYFIEIERPSGRLNCKEQVLLKAQANEFDPTTIEYVCPRASVFYNCSFYTDARFLNLTWHITYPQQTPVSIMYDHQSAVNYTQPFSSTIQSSLKRYRANEYIESLLSLEFGNDSVGPTVQCSVDTIPTAQLSLILYQAPSAPIDLIFTNFHTVGNYSNLTASIVLPSGLSETFRPEYYEVSIRPEPLAQPVTERFPSSFELQLDIDTVYTYTITSVRCGERNSSFVKTLQIQDIAPKVSISYFGQEGVFAGGLQLELREGSSVPTFYCFSNSSLPTSFTWRRTNYTIPNGIIQSSMSGGLGLVWNRRAQLDDASVYECEAVNSNGTGIARLELSVVAPPTVTAVFPTSPYMLNSTTIWIPVGYRGVVLTCLAFGFPTVLSSVNWVKSGQQQIVSNTTNTNVNSHFSAVGLTFNRNGFQFANVGNYSCSAYSNGRVSSQIAIFTIQLAVGGPILPLPCSVDNEMVYFEVRVLNTTCSVWDASLKQHVTFEFLRTIRAVLEIYCQDCLISGDNLITYGTVLCSDIVERAAIFRGVISSNEISETNLIFCALSSWHQLGSAIVISDNLRQVDSGCRLRMPSPDALECSIPRTLIQSSTSLIAGSSSGVGVLAVVALVGFVVFAAVIRTKSSTDRKIKAKIGTKPKRMDAEDGSIYHSVYHGSMYEDNDDYEFLANPDDFNSVKGYQLDDTTTIYHERGISENEFKSRTEEHSSHTLHGK